MLVSVVSNAGMFRDFLANAVVDYGYSLKSINDQVNLSETYAPDECVIVYMQKDEPRVCDALTELRYRQPKMPIAVVCAKGLERSLTAKIGQKVNVIMPDDRPLELIIGALTVVTQGYTLLDSSYEDDPPDENVETATAALQPFESTRGVGLSKRENMVLQGIRNGMSNKEIARELEISESTVKVHMRSIFRKIGVHNRTQAAIWATDHSPRTLSPTSRRKQSDDRPQDSALSRRNTVPRDPT